MSNKKTAMTGFQAVVLLIMLTPVFNLQYLRIYRDVKMLQWFDLVEG